MSGPVSEGTVLHVLRKPETPGQRGLPKVEVAEARVTRQGLEGDFNRFRHEEASDSPDMALLLMPLETIRTLNEEGWPVRPGDLGENLTTTGIPYDAFRPSRKLRLGTALAEVSKPCTPCDNLYLLPYVGPERGPEFLRVMLDRRGWYCRVLEPGQVRTGDAIRFESP
jgi:MOSC domain-containing protein YiiM